MTVQLPLSNHCPTCKASSSSTANPRNLAVFIDGTSNKPGEENTNVTKLYNEVKFNSASEGSEPEQRTFYLQGIGAGENVNLPQSRRMATGISSAIEMAFARNVRQNMERAYSWLVETYRDGDHIYMFGFSRGAYQVRSLASMIHEVGLVRDRHRIKAAYQHYRAIDPCDDETRANATHFKKYFCWQGVRVHFVGVWDTVSSLGLIKKDVHITSSASVTNACHFRHALALDERRVKFMPEYFTEVNAHRELRSPKRSAGDVEEVWFAGSHSDVGGTASRQHSRVAEANSTPYPIHAGNVSLEWMKREAVAHGLFFKKGMLAWDPEDVDLGRKDTMTRLWRILEVFPIRQQVSFSGTGKHATRPHLSRPRSVIPSQRIHSSVLSCDVYTPRAVLGNCIDIPTMPRRVLSELWTAELQDEGITTQLLELLVDQQRTLGCLERVLFLLNHMLEKGHPQRIPVVPSRWSRAISEQSGLNKFALTVIYDVISNFSVSEDLLRDAKEALRAVLSSTNKPYPAGVFCVVRFSAKHQHLRRRFIAHEGVIGALMVALEQAAKCAQENSYPLVMDSLCYLINDENLRNDVVKQLYPRLSVTLKVKEPTHLVASLKMITCLAENQQSLYGDLRTRVTKLSKKSCPVGPAALEVLVALKAPLSRNVPTTNILAYLGNALPRLDAEVGATASLNDIGDLDLPYVHRAHDSSELDERVMFKFVSALQSRDARKRSAVTLTLLKLCKNTTIRSFCLQYRVFDVFARQLKAKRTCLLAAYALKICIEQGITSFDHDDVAKSIVVMLSRGWFDDVVGQIEGFEVFRQLLNASDELNRRIVSPEAVTTLVQRLGDGKRHEVRMCLLCLDMLDSSAILTNLRRHVRSCIANLSAKSKDVRARSANTLSELAQTKTGEEAILPFVIDIVKMLPRSPTKVSGSRSTGPIVVVRNLCKNEMLRDKIRNSDEFCAWKREYGRAAPR